MQYRTLGNTGLEVSVLGFGGSPLGSVFETIDEAEGVHAVHEALDLGVNYFDTSPFYGDTRAEAVLGRALKDLPRDRYHLATKVGRYGPDFPDFDFSADRVTRSVDESLKRLNVEHVDLIQVHDMEFGDADQIVNETIPALRQVIERGKARYLGITCLPLRLLADVSDRADVDAILSYCHYSLNDTALETLIPDMQRKGVGVISAAPLSMGLLTPAGPPPWHPAPPRVKDACAEAVRRVQQRGGDITQLALQFSAANDAIATTLVGMADRETLRRNVRALEAPMDESLLREAQEALAAVKDVTWTSGHPQNN